MTEFERGEEDGERDAEINLIPALAKASDSPKMDMYWIGYRVGVGVIEQRRDSQLEAIFAL